MALEVLIFFISTEKIMAHSKGTLFFFSAEKFMAHSFIQNSEVRFFFPAKREKKNTCFFFFSQEKFIRRSFKIWWGFNYFIKK